MRTLIALLVLALVRIGAAQSYRDIYQISEIRTDTLRVYGGSTIYIKSPVSIASLFSATDFAVSDSLYFLRGFGVDLVLTDDFSADSGYFAGHLRGNKGLYGKDSVGTAGLVYGVNSRLSGWGIFGGTTDTVKAFLTLGGYEAVRVDSDTLYIGLLTDSVQTIPTAAIVDSAVDSTKLGRHAINDSSKIAPNIITADRLVINCIDSTKIADQSVNYVQDGDSTSVLVAASARAHGQIVADDSVKAGAFYSTGNSSIGGVGMNASTVTTNSAVLNGADIDSTVLGFFLSIFGIRQYPAFIDSFTPATTALLCAVPGAAGSDAVSGSIWEATPLPTDTTAAGALLSFVQAEWNGPGYVSLRRAIGDSADYKYVKLRCVYRP